MSNPSEPGWQQPPAQPWQQAPQPWQQVPPQAGMQPMGHYGAPLMEHPQASTVLVLGMIGFFVVGITGPIAWIMGSKARREIDEGRYAPSPTLTIGWVLGIITTVIMALGVLAVLVGLVVLLTAGTTAGS